jgi:prepilin-type N-terminal cleavage/methylation domain-containing protein
MAKRTPRKNRFGFTLVEIMVTLSILGLLLALAIPNVQKTLIVRHVDGTFREVSNIFKLAAQTASSQGGGIRVVVSNVNNDNVMLQKFDDVNLTGGQPTLLQQYISPNDVAFQWSDTASAPNITTPLTIHYWGTGAADDAVSVGTVNILPPGVLNPGDAAPNPITVQFLSTNTSMTISTKEAQINISNGSVTMIGL